MPEITITLTIHVPEGSTVNVVPQAPRAVPAGPLAQALAAAPPHVAGNDCPLHRLPWKFVPAGHSNRTGKDFVAFYACPEQGCKQRPPQGWRSPNAAPPEGDPEWDELARMAG
jgi:hypothetical protein